MAEEAKVAQEEVIFNIEKIYVKEASLEIPHAPEIFLVQEMPEVEMQIGVDHKSLENDIYECTLTITVTAKTKDEKVAFLCETSQSGIFTIRGFSAEDVDGILNVTCPNILYPYLRENISSLTIKATFPPVVLVPLNFDAMYQQKLQQAATKETGEA